MRPEKVIVNRALQGLISLHFIIVIPIFVTELLAFYKERHRFSFWNPSTRWRLPLAGTSLCALLLAALDGAYEWHDWVDNPDGCYISSGFITLFFVFMKQCLNLFLYDRAKIVHLALQIDDWRLTALRWCLWITITVGVHAFFAWSYFINFYGFVSEDTDCIFKTRYPAVIVSFAVSDAFLNTGMLLLFFVPLYIQTRKLNSEKIQATSKIQSMMRRNMIISLAVTTVDVTSLSLMSFFFWNTTDDGSMEYRILWGNFAAVFDQIVVIVGSHSMTAGWVPPAWRAELKKRLTGCSRQKAGTVDMESLTSAHAS